MRRLTVLGVVLAVGSISVAVRAYQQPEGDRQVEVQKVRDNLFVLTGGGGNTAVFIQSQGVTVVDTKLPGWGKPILDRIRELTDKPVTMIVNTHTHGDHVSGNVEFPHGVEVIVQENTKENMSRMMSPPGMGTPTPGKPTIFQEHMGHGLPRKTFTDRLTLGSGADQVDLHYFGRGHTNGDAIVVFPAHRVVHTGDLFPGKQVPIMDSNNGGSGVEYPATLKKAHDALTGMETVIPGHSTLMSPKDLLEFSEFVRDLVEAVRQGKKAGQTAEQIAAGWTVPAKYAGYAAPQAARLRTNVELIYKELP